MANYNKNITLVVGGSINQYFYRQNVISGDTLTVRVNNGHSGYNVWYASTSSSITPSSYANSSGSGYGLAPATGIVFTVTGGSSYNLIFSSYYSGSFKTHHIFGTVSAASAAYSLSAPTSIQEGTTGTVNISATNHTAGVVYWSATPAADFSTSTGSAYVNSSGTGSFTLTPTSDNTTEGNETATIRLYSNSARTIQIASTTTTLTDQGASGGGGGSSGGGATGGSTSQGINVFSPNGTKVFGTDLRTQNIQHSYQEVVAAGATSTTKSMADANSGAKALIIILGYYQPGDYTINTSSTGFNITNNTGGQRTIDVLAVRIG